MGSILDTLLHNESGGRNIANTTSGTNSGQAQGFFQITTGTWRDFAPRVGVDLNKYPTPMIAADGTPVPYAVQASVANNIPLNRWAPSTVALVQQTGKSIDPSKTLGENLSANGENILQTTTGATSTSSAPASTTLMPTFTPSAGEAFAYLNNNQLYDEGVPVEPVPQRSPLADTLANSVDTAASQRQSSEPIGYNDLMGRPKGGTADTLPLSSLASQQEGTEVQAPPAVDPASSDQSLADLFKVKEFGLAGRTDPRTGQPLLNRYRVLG